MQFEQAQMWRRLQDKPGNYYCQAAEPEREEFRKFFESLLFTGRATIEFTKTDGSSRVMICTLSEDHGAKYSNNDTNITKTPKSNRKPTTDVRTVWDCEANAWRSFRWDSLLRVDYTIG